MLGAGFVPGQDGRTFISVQAPHRSILPLGDVMRLTLSPAQSRSGSLRRTVRRFAAALLVSSMAMTPAFAGTPIIQNSNPRMTPAVEAARKVKGAVVNIHSERTVTSAADPFHPEISSVNRVNGMGTGIVIDPRGYIVTNNHVVDEVQVLRVHLADGSSHAARIVARDPENDIAIIKINAGVPLPTIPLGTATDLMILEPVIAIGNAFGYEHTHTLGSVSAIKRDVALNKEMSYKGLIQTDASINPGNSGGPLINLYGELIGVNVAIRAGAQNIGFAIPVDTMIRAAADLISLQHRLGVSHGIVVRDHIDASRNPITRTCMIERTECGSPAERAGLRNGDQILQVGGIEVGCSLDMERGFLEKRSGEKVAILIRRNFEDKPVELTIPSSSPVVASSSPVGTLTSAASADPIWRRMGVRLVAVDSSAVAQSNPQLRGGVLIQDIATDGAAAQAGIQRGDVLVGLNNFETLTPENVNWILSQPDVTAAGPLKFFVVRNGQVRHGLLSQLSN
jgi:serine protease Do